MLTKKEGDSNCRARLGRRQLRHRCDGLIAGLWPALRAAQLSPTEALWIVCGRWLGTREVHRDDQATFGLGTNLETRHMGFGDVGDDGETKPEPVRAGGSLWDGALKGIEQTSDLVGWHERSGVGHGQDRSSGPG